MRKLYIPFRRLGHLVFWRRYIALVAFFVMSIGVGSFFVLHIPLGASNDEQAHDLRAFAVSKGIWISQPVGKDRGLTMYGSHVPLNFARLELHTAWAKRIRCTPTVCLRAPAGFNRQTVHLAAQPIRSISSIKLPDRGAAAYIGIPYLPAAAAMWWATAHNFTVGTMLHMARFFSLGTFIIIVAWALWLLRLSRARWLVLAVALLPQSMALAASVSVDPILNALALLFFALSIRLYKSRGKVAWHLVIPLLLLAILLPLCKPPYAILSLIALFLPLYRRGWQGWLQRVLLIVLIAAPTVWWSSVTSNMSSTQSALTKTHATRPNEGRQLHYIIAHPLSYPKALGRSFFSEDWLTSVGGPLTHQLVPLPVTITLCSYGLLGIASLAAAKDFSASFKRRFRPGLIYGGLGLLCLLAIGVAVYASYSPVGSPTIEGFNGRYLIPVLPFLGLGLALCSRTRLTFTARSWLYFTLFTCLVLLFAADWYYHQVYVWSVASLPMPLP